MAYTIGAEHQFHDAAFVREWANRFVPTEPRLALFDMILDQVLALGIPDPAILELGIGPAYMARHIVERAPPVQYEGLDFSDVFFDVARHTLGPLAARVSLTKADLTAPGWPACVRRNPHAIISTWALHDLGSEQAVADVYRRCFSLLPEGGILVNGDFIKPDGIGLPFEGGRFEIARHLELLRDAGFSKPVCLGEFEQEMAQPTPSQNYACLVAKK